MIRPSATGALRLMLLAMLVLEVGCKACAGGHEDDQDPSVVDADGDGSLSPDDCDDADDAVHPGASEVCDGLDNDCDDKVDEDGPSWYADADGDGFGDVNGNAVQACEGDQPGDTVQDATDCDDSDADVNPDAVELCADGLDNDCDDEVDEADAEERAWYADADGDGYGSDDEIVYACDQPEGYQALGGDCDDEVATTNPGAFDPADDMDNDCDGETDDDLVNFDGFIRYELSWDMEDLEHRDCIAVVYATGEWLRVRARGELETEDVTWAYEVTWTLDEASAVDATGHCETFSIDDRLTSKAGYVAWLPDEDEPLWATGDTDSWRDATAPLVTYDDANVRWDPETGLLSWEAGYYEDSSDPEGVGISTNWSEAEFYVIPRPEEG